MHRYVAITLLLVTYSDYNSAATPFQLTIDCDCEDDFTSNFDRAIPKAIEDGHFILDKNNPHDMKKSASEKVSGPHFSKAPKNFDSPKLKRLNTINPPKLSPMPRLKTLFSNEESTLKPVPRFKPYRFRPPKVRTPHFLVPKLKPALDRAAKPPALGSAYPYPRRIFERDQEPSSAEKIEFIKKGVQKMMKFVKVLGQIDQYVSDRTRIIIDKLSKTFVED